MEYSKIVAGAIIYRYNESAKEILVIRRSQYSSFPGEWEFSRGVVEKSDATTEDAAKREAKEETGIGVEINNLFNKFEYVKEKDGETIKVLQINYLCKPVSMAEQVKLRYWEHDRFRWIRTVDEVPLKKEIKETLKKVFSLAESETYTETKIKTVVGESVVFDL